MTGYLLLILAGFLVIVAAGAWSRRGATPLPPRTAKLLLGVIGVGFVLAGTWIVIH